MIGLSYSRLVFSVSNKPFDLFWNYHFFYYNFHRCHYITIVCCNHKFPLFIIIYGVIYYLIWIVTAHLGEKNVFVLTEKGSAMHSLWHDYFVVYINIESLYPFDGQGSERKEWRNFDRHFAQANKAPTSETGAKEFNRDATRNLSSRVVTYLYYGWRVSELIRQRRQRLRRIIWNSVENNSGAVVRENEINS